MGYAFSPQGGYNSQIMKRSLAVKLGPHHEIDEMVRLGAAAGRKYPKPTPLLIGSHARVRSGTVIYQRTIIGNYFETGHGVIVREDNRLGNHVSIWNNTTIDYGCTIGHRVKIHCNCYIAQFTTIEDDVFIAPGVIFANDLFPKGPNAAEVLQGPIIKRGAAIGVNCTILPGVTIGEHALIGAGSVVTRPVAPHAVVWGNPAQAHKSRRDLKWPEGFTIQRKAAKHFYQKHLSGKAVHG